MRLGWVKLHRKLLGSQAFKNEGLLKVWIWCLLRAAHEETWVTLRVGKGTTEVHLKPGEFIFGRESASQELNMNPSTIYKRMQKLKNMRNCNIQSNSHYSIVSIINWGGYQDVTKKSNSQSNSRVTAKEQPSNTKKNLEKEENVKNRKNLFVETDPQFRLAEFLFKKIKANNPKAKKPNFQSWAKHVDLMIRIDKRELGDIQAVIEWCQSDSFWQSNILSTAKLRDKFDQLWSKMNAEGGNDDARRRDFLRRHGED